MSILKKVIVRILPIVAIGIGGTLVWNHYLKSEPDQTPKEMRQSRGSTKRPVVTKVKKLEVLDYQIKLRTQGSLIPANVTTLTPQVSGKVVFINKNFQKGLFVKQGEILLKVDPADYEGAVITAEASLARAEASLAQEVARGEQALRNWKDIGFSEKPNDLVLRKPQLKQAKANVKSAEASLAGARREKQRCDIKAPFSGVVRNRLIGYGSSVSANSRLGELLETEYAEIRLPLSSIQLSQLNETVGEKNKDGVVTSVTFKDAIQPNSGRSWTGKIVRKESEMDLTSRELYVIAKIEDPFNLKKNHPYPLTFNQPLLASIPAKTLHSVVVIPRQYIQGVNDIIGVKNARIKKLKITPIWETPDSVIVDAKQIPEGLQIATSKLNYAAEGAPVKVIPSLVRKDEESSKIPK